MKINIEDYLHIIDTYFKNKKKQEVYMTFIMVIGLIFSFSYTFFWDSSFSEFETTRKNVQSFASRIIRDKAFVSLNPETKITNITKEITTINEKIIEQKDNNAYIKSKIETISSLIYNEKSWGKYLKSISQNAKKHEVKIIKFTNKYANNNNSFGYILDINIQSVGTYKNTLKFINALEQSELVVDIHDLKIQVDKQLVCELKISVWGITY